MTPNQEIPSSAGRLDPDHIMLPWIQKPLSLGKVVMLASLGFALLSLLLLVPFSHIIRNKAIEDMVKEDARQTSRLIFQSLFAVMEEGWEKKDIERIVRRINDEETELKVRIFRGQPVIDEYGTFPGEAETIAQDLLLRRALLQGKEALARTEDTVRFIYPIKAVASCQECHEKSQPGDINGVLDITFPIQNIKISLSYVLNAMLIYFAFCLLLLTLLLYLKLRMLYVRPITRMAAAMGEIIQHMDLKVKMVPTTKWVKELQFLTDYFNRLLTSIQQYNEELHELSVRDPLTGLYNRRRFEDMLSQEIARSRRHGHSFSVLMLDLDNFKYINDTFGHPTGDILLKEISVKIQKNCRHSDVLARLGGDEFGIILPETDCANSLKVGEKIRTALLEKPFPLPVGEAQVAISAGVSCFPGDGDSPTALLGSADIALYRAKRRGKNRVVTADGPPEELDSAEIVKKGAELRRAIDEQRVDAFLQPILSTADHEIFGYEVLARVWKDKQLVAASHFIEVAEELGIIGELDRHVREKGFQALLMPKYHGKKFFFNFSARELADRAEMQVIKERIQELAIPPGTLVFEITEREALPQLSQISELIDEFKKLGVAFALDDFGSGFSSFLYLKYLNVDYVKIEGSFVRQMIMDERDKLMVEHINTLSKQFGLKTIAEFVEDEGTHKELVKMGVDFAQGYYYGRPESA